LCHTIQSQKEVEEERLRKGLKARKRRAAAVPDDSVEDEDEGEDEDEDASSEPEEVGDIPFEIIRIRNETVWFLVVGIFT
jgi:hypothetical protein